VTDDLKERIEQKLRNVAYCQMRVPGEDHTIANFTLALKAARLIKRQRKEIQELMDELAYHGIYPK
jgi:hypothetical protein